MATATTRPRRKPKAEARPPRAGKPRRPRGARSRGQKVLHACGHTQERPARGRAWQREKDAAYFATQPCTACWGAQKAAEAEALCGFPGIEGFPALEGTPRQVPWARTIRATLLGRLKAEAAHLDRLLAGWGLPAASGPYLDLAAGYARDERRARWWIDERDATDAMALFLPMKELHEFQDLIAHHQPCPF